MIDAYLVEWLNLLGRWVHVITGVAWIGASFYFVWLDNHLEDPKSADDAERARHARVSNSLARSLAANLPREDGKRFLSRGWGESNA